MEGQRTGDQDDADHVHPIQWQALRRALQSNPTLNSVKFGQPRLATVLEPGWLWDSTRERPGAEKRRLTGTIVGRRRLYISDNGFELCGGCFCDRTTRDDVDDERSSVFAVNYGVRRSDQLGPLFNRAVRSSATSIHFLATPHISHAGRTSRSAVAIDLEQNTLFKGHGFEVTLRAETGRVADGPEDLFDQRQRIDQCHTAVAKIGGAHDSAYLAQGRAECLDHDVLLADEPVDDQSKPPTSGCTNHDELTVVRYTLTQLEQLSKLAQRRVREG